MPTPDELQTAVGMWLRETLERLPTKQRPFAQAFGDHLGADASGLPLVAEDFDSSEHANLQLALDAYTRGAVTWHGVTGLNKRFGGLTLSDLVQATGAMHEPKPGPVEYLNRAIGPTEWLACIQFGYALLETDAGRAVLFMRGPTEHSRPPTGQIEVMAVERATAETLIRRLRELMAELNVYRGKVVTFAFNEFGGHDLEFASLPKVTRDQVILPEPVLLAMERHTFRMSEIADRLRAAGRHLKRGILLYGVPGTGKTHSLAYLASRMDERTIILLSGVGLGALGRAFALARVLQPAMVVLEDVDLVAMSRNLPGMDVNPLLFELLNQMDGLAEDVDLIVALTTNRVDLLEPALAARPGRIDHALEFPLPDANLRRRLIELYGQGIDLRLTDWDGHLARSEGVSPALIKEWLRRAAILSIEAGSEAVEDDHLEAARQELVEGGERLVRMLGGQGPPPS